ncbi:MAG: flagellar hook assembly protein FlgD [Bdellovibrionota bacterium]
MKTEWADSPSARRTEDPVPKNAPKIGDQLNEMTGATAPKDPYAVTKKKNLDKDAFLKMFMTQIKYQDPTSPVDNEKMAQQMAMFSQLEQSVTTNQYLEKMVAKTGDDQQLAFSMIGKTVAVDKAALFHSKMEPSLFNFNLPQDAAELKVEIVNDAGETVKTIPMTGHGQGEVKVRWDGMTEDGQAAASGRYFYKVDAKGLNANPITVESKLEGKVSGITRAGGETFLLVGDQRIRMNEVNSVKDTSIAPAPSMMPTQANIPAGTETVSNNVAAPEATESQALESGPQIEIGKDVGESLRNEEDPRDRIDSHTNPLMSVFMR